MRYTMKILVQILTCPFTYGALITIVFLTVLPDFYSTARAQEEVDTDRLFPPLETYREIPDSVTGRINTPESYQKLVCKEYATLMMNLVKKQQALKCEITTETWSDNKEQYEDTCIEQRSQKEALLTEINRRERLLGAYCFTRAGDLAAHDWCYDLDAIHSGEEEGKKYIRSNINVYGILKNVGPPWYSGKDGTITIDVNRPSLGHHHSTKSNKLTEEWRHSGEAWRAIACRKYELYVSLGEEEERKVDVLGFDFEHPEDTNSRNNSKEFMKTGYVNAIEFFEASDAKSPETRKIIQRDGSMVNQKCKYKSLGNDLYPSLGSFFGPEERVY